MPDSQGLVPEPPAPAGVKTSPALESRDTVFLFLFIFFLPSAVPGSEAGAGALPQVLAVCVTRDPDV